MKKFTITLIAIILCLSVNSLYAQDQATVSTSNNDTHTSAYIYTGWKHNIRISASCPGLLSTYFTTNMDLSYYNPSTTDSDNLANLRYYRTPTYYFPGVNIEYSYGINHITHIGAKVSIAGAWNSIRHCATDDVLYHNSNIAIGAIVNVRFDWLRRKSVQMYSSIGLGLAARFTFNNSRIVPMYDATYVGASFGRNLYGFVEFGGGISGLFRAGIGYRF